MPRYDFNLRHKLGPDGLAVDPEGDELADDTEARAYALRSARDLITRTQSYSVRDCFASSFEVTDLDGRPVLTVPFSDTVSDTEGSD